MAKFADALEFATWFGDAFEPEIMALNAVLELDTCDEQPDTLVVHGLKVAPPRGQGVGSRIIAQLCQEADKAGVTLMVQPEPLKFLIIKPISQADLERFYARQGFVAVPGSKFWQRVPVRPSPAKAPAPSP